MTTIAVTTPLARIDHRCDLCSRTIGRGERYENQKSIWDGRFCVFKCCAHCRVLVAAFDAEAGWGAWYDIEGYSQDSIDDYEPQSFATARLVVMFRRRWRRRDGRLYPVPDLPSKEKTDV